VTRQLVTTVLDARGREAGDQDLDWLGELLASAGAVDSVINVDTRTGLVRATFAVDEDPSHVIADFRSQVESRGGWTLAGTASYAVSEPEGRGRKSRRWPGLVLASAAIVLWVCALAGFVPYDFDDGPVGYLLGVSLFAVPIGMVAAGRLPSVGQPKGLRAP
jgi:hypothetical protein